MGNLIVVNNPRDWPLAIPGVTVVSARAYLTDPAYGGDNAARVFNLCRSYRYQTLGYYVSLLAEARGHKPLPRTNTIEDLQSQNIVRLLTEGLDELIQKSLAQIKSDTFELNIYFGHSAASHHDQLSRQLFNLLQSPLLRAIFQRRGSHWYIRSVRPIAASDIPPQHQEFAIRATNEYFTGRRRHTQNLSKKKLAPRYNLAILHDPDNPEPASNAKALQKFEKAAHALGMHVEFITKADYGRLTEFDALFIRDTTFVNHYTYRFSRRAAAEGLVVIDDPDSILKCNNKVYLAEILARHRIPAPKTLLVHRDNVNQIIPELGLPCVLKQPDSSFSLGVVKVETEAELSAKVNGLLDKSELIVAQKFLPTEFDWRIGILDRRPLFVAKYFMVPGHWQIIQHGDEKHDFVEGKTEALSVGEAPDRVVKMALRAAKLIGDGFYGVDIKQIGKRLYVIEINDNPNVDAGNEDSVLRDALYREVMAVFLKRIEARKRGTSR
jgi:glutathione synthase/RimK-type ligase-like ATP-grasp enzyme